MARGSDLLGLPVVNAQTGRRIGRVEDLILAEGGRRLAGLVLETAGWWRPALTIRWGAVQAVGRGAILVAAESGQPEEGIEGRCWRQLAGKPALTDTGEELGLLADLWWEADGAVSGYQLSAGLLDDLIFGQPVLPVPAAIRCGDEAIFFPSRPGSGGGESA